MSCNCTQVIIQGSQFCGQCMPDETNWLVPMAEKPDPFLMDRHHAYITPDGTVYVLDHAGKKAIALSGGGGQAFDPSDILQRIQEANNKITELENRPDRDTDTIYDDTEVKGLIQAINTELEKLKAKGDNDTVYDDTEVKERITALETKEDNDKQTLTLEGNTLSISNGNSVTLPTGTGTGTGNGVDKDTKYEMVLTRGYNVAAGLTSRSLNADEYMDLKGNINPIDIVNGGLYEYYIRGFLNLKETFSDPEAEKYIVNTNDNMFLQNDVTFPMERSINTKLNYTFNTSGTLKGGVVLRTMLDVKSTGAITLRGSITVPQYALGEDGQIDYTTAIAHTIPLTKELLSAGTVTVKFPTKPNSKWADTAIINTSNINFGIYYKPHPTLRQIN